MEKAREAWASPTLPPTQTQIDPAVFVFIIDATESNPGHRNAVNSFSRTLTKCFLYSNWGNNYEINGLLTIKIYGKKQCFVNSPNQIWQKGKKKICF